MNIGKCLVSSDANPLYLDFFPLVFRAWKEILGIEVELILIADQIPPVLKTYERHITLFPKIEGVHTGFQAQCARLLMPQLSKVEADKAVIISDIDMVPLNNRYYTRPISKLLSDKFIVYRANILRENSEIAICYNAATPDTWGDLFGKVHNLLDVKTSIMAWHHAVEYDGKHGGAGWSTDQQLLHSKVELFDQRRVVRLDDKSLGFVRLDRSEIKSKLSLKQKLRIIGRHYSDCHMKRPYAEYNELNETIVNMCSRTFLSLLD